MWLESDFWGWGSGRREGIVYLVRFWMFEVFRDRYCVRSFFTVAFIVVMLGRGFLGGWVGEGSRGFSSFVFEFSGGRFV